ncbi:hypothetical protein D7Z26_19395 [Cohnella endophytica]|uniref:Uncharacterized protein n=1 Tax=Cohnella endophytica TaxID=2419778 RepID=A0A494XPJ6_9BACL|nr:hypothetical protein D7Z26_19395 [Cohnella endophytica]
MGCNNFNIPDDDRMFQRSNCLAVSKPIPLFAYVWSAVFVCSWSSSMLFITKRPDVKKHSLKRSADLSSKFKMRTEHPIRVTVILTARNSFAIAPHTMKNIVRAQFWWETALLTMNNIVRASILKGNPLFWPTCDEKHRNSSILVGNRASYDEKHHKGGNSEGKSPILTTMR